MRGTGKPVFWSDSLIITHLLNKTLCDFLFCLFQCHVWAKSLLIGNFVLNILLPIRLLLDQLRSLLFIYLFFDVCGSCLNCSSKCPDMMTVMGTPLVSMLATCHPEPVHVIWSTSSVDMEGILLVWVDDLLLILESFLLF